MPLNFKSKHMFKMPIQDQLKHNFQSQKYKSWNVTYYSTLFSHFSHLRNSEPSGKIYSQLNKESGSEFSSFLFSLCLT